MALIIRNTFIDVDELDTSNGSAQRRSSSEPPGCSFGTQGDGEKSPREIELQRDQQSLSEQFAESISSSSCSDDARSAGRDESPYLSACSDDSDGHDDTPLVSPCTNDSSKVSQEVAKPCQIPSDSDLERCSDDRSSADGDSDSRDFCICVNKIENPQLGIDVKRTPKIALLVKSVNLGGLVDKWNHANPPHLRVEAGNYIVTVNGISGDAEAMLKECQRENVLRMRVITDASHDRLATLVNTIPGSRRRRKATKPKIDASSELSRSTASTTVAASTISEALPGASDSHQDEWDSLDTLEADAKHSLGDGELVSSHSGATQSYPAQTWASSTMQAPELSLANLLPMSASFCQSASSSLDSPSIYQESWRTKLKSSAPAFAPSRNGGGGEIVVSARGAYGEMSEVLKNTAQALTFSSDVQGIQVIESELVASATIHIELPPLPLPSCNSLPSMRRMPAMPHASHVVRKLAKSSLLDAAANSQNVYVVGYLGDPFHDVGDSCFKATLAYMRREDTACATFVQKGRCANRRHCRWCHPTSEEMMVVLINFQHGEQQYQ